MKTNKFYALNILSVLGITLFFLQACNKKNDHELSNKEVVVKVSTSVSQFGDGGVKLRASIKEPESFSSSLELSKDLLMISTLTPINESSFSITNRASTGNGNRAALGTSNLDPGEVYKLVIYNSNGSYRTFRNYRYGSPQDTPPLSLPINQSFTFVAYSLNGTSFTDLNNVFPDSTVSLSQAKLVVQNNPDLLIYKNSLIVDEENNDLGIIFKHQFNEITTIIDASDSGYSIDPSSLETRFSIARNVATISFSNLGQVNSLGTTGFQVDLNGTAAYNFTAANGVSNAIATSKTTTLINTDNKTSLFSVRNVKIGTVTSSLLNPFSAGVSMIPGYKYRLDVRIVPRDRTLVYEQKPAVLLGGQVWMRYSLGSHGDINNSNGDDADVPGANIHGAYYQWGQKLPGINANSTSTNANWINTGISGNEGLSYFQRWNTGTNTNPVKGAQDPCPTGYRLPVKKDFETLLSYIENDYRNFVNSSGSVNYVLQLTSKYNAKAKLTFAASGYGYMGNDDGRFNVGYGGLYDRYRAVYLKTSYYGDGNPTAVASSGAPGPSLTAYQTRYMLYSPTIESTAANRILTYPGSARVSAPVNAHPVRCIAISSAAAIFKMNEREVHSGGNNNVNF